MRDLPAFPHYPELGWPEPSHAYTPHRCQIHKTDRMAMTLATSIEVDTAGMDHAIAGPTHSNTTLRHLDRGDTTKEVLYAYALKECTRQAMRTRPTTGIIQRETPLPQPVATARSSRELLPWRLRGLSNEQASKQASGVIRVVNTLGYTQLVGDNDRWQIVNDALS